MVDSVPPLDGRRVPRLATRRLSQPSFSAKGCPTKESERRKQKNPPREDGERKSAAANRMRLPIVDWMPWKEMVLVERGLPTESIQKSCGPCERWPPFFLNNSAPCA